MVKLLVVLTGAAAHSYSYSYSYALLDDARIYGTTDLVYELHGHFAPQSFLELDVWVDCVKIIEKCEMTLSSASILSSAGPCDMLDRNEAVFPSLMYDDDRLIHDIDTCFVLPDRTLEPLKHSHVDLERIHDHPCG